jgi:BirA family biotin operon repressor/biotin-[acetyl-CoA-carboxylase] ligase
MEMSAEATRVKFAVLGIGVNLNVDREHFPDEFRSRATSLASHTGKPVDRLAFARRLYGNLEVTLDVCAERGFEGVRAEFDARFLMRGKPVSVLEVDGSELRGTALGIDDDGALRLQLETGDVIRVIAGDVTLAKEST